jgi:hypothetical protein
MKLPRKVITIDHGDGIGDLFIRFKHAKTTYRDTELTKDGQAIIQYYEKGEIAAIDARLFTLKLFPFFIFNFYPPLK